MQRHNPLVDEYIEKSADFAKPILNYLREKRQKLEVREKEVIN